MNNFNADIERSELPNNGDDIFDQIGKFQRTKTEQFKAVNETLRTFLAELGKKFSRADQDKIRDALMLMYTVHIDQEDRVGGEPYVSHTLNVAKKVLEMFDLPDCDLVIAALLHDSVEDQAYKLSLLLKIENEVEIDEHEAALKVLENKYGQKVAKIVAALSNPDFDAILEERGVTRDNAEYTNRKNKLYAEHVKEAIEDPDVLAIKIVDFSENALKLSSWRPENEKGLAKRAKLKKKYLPVMDIFIERLAKDDLLPDFKKKIEEERDLLNKENDDHVQEQTK